MSNTPEERLILEIFGKIREEVDNEIASPICDPAQHGRPIGYSLGCRGPLCRRSNRDRQRKKNMASYSEMEDQYLERRLQELRNKLAAQGAARRSA